MNSKEIWMIDLEGTLTDNAWRQHLITGENKNWKEYYRGLERDPAVKHIINLVNNLLSCDDKQVIVYTTRMPNKYNLEDTWLDKNNIKIRDTLFRENTKLPGPQLLRAWCEDYRPHAVIDDRPDNRNAVRDIVSIVIDPRELIGLN